MTRVFIPRDATALSLGAERVARAIADAAQARGLALDIVRTGSRGLFWLEPMVEVETPAGRVAYGPVAPGDVAGLFPALLDGGAHALRPHALYLGAPEQIPYLARQERLTFARCGVVDPLSVADYRAHGGFRGLTRALTMAPMAVVQEVIDSGLRGRGGAGFPTGIKWRTVAQADADQKYIVCNADEGDSGTFADRMLMEGDPFLLIEGMAIAGAAVGATRGTIYLRSEYPHAHRALTAAIANAYDAGWLGARIGGSGVAFDLEVRLGAGAYICGEETALLESLEGKRGQVRYRPPLPAVKGLFGKPTVINNVLSLAAAPTILAEGAAFYRNYGVGRSRGTQPLQLAGNVKRPGLVEKAFGLSLRELIEDFGGGTASGRPIRAVQVGGPLGSYIPADKLDLAIDYEALAAAKGLLGHGGVVVFDDTVDMAAQARFAMEFCAHESCGKCTPCRIGAVRGVEVIDRIVAGEARANNTTLLRDLCETMVDGSLCALGGLTPLPVLSALDHFPEDFARPAPAAAAE
jgi:formate dehydrogenase iron-sulfur subunit